MSEMRPGPSPAEMGMNPSKNEQPQDSGLGKQQFELPSDAAELANDLDSIDVNRQGEQPVDEANQDVSKTAYDYARQFEGAALGMRVVTGSDALKNGNLLELYAPDGSLVKSPAELYGVLQKNNLSPAEIGRATEAYAHLVNQATQEREKSVAAEQTKAADEKAAAETGQLWAKSQKELGAEIKGQIAEKRREERWERFESKKNELFDKAQVGVTAVKSKATGLFGRIASAARTAVAKVGGAVSAGAGVVRTGFERTANAIDQGATSVGNASRAGAELGAGAAKAIADGAMEMGRGIAGEVEKTALEAKLAAQEIGREVKALVERVGEVKESVTRKVEGWMGWLKERGESIQKAAKERLDGLKALAVKTAMHGRERAFNLMYELDTQSENQVVARIEQLEEKKVKIADALKQLQALPGSVYVRGGLGLRSVDSARAAHEQQLRRLDQKRQQEEQKWQRVSERREASRQRAEAARAGYDQQFGASQKEPGAAEQSTAA